MQTLIVNGSPRPNGGTETRAWIAVIRLVSKLKISGL